MKSKNNLINKINICLIISITYFVNHRVLSQNYFPLEDGFQWRYSKVVTNNRVLDKYSPTILEKKVIFNQQVDTEKFKRMFLKDGINTPKHNIENKITVETIEITRPNKKLFELYKIDSLSSAIIFDEVYYHVYDDIYGVVEEQYDWFEPDLPLDFSRPVRDTLKIDGYLFSYYYSVFDDHLTQRYCWYYHVESIILPKESISVEGKTYHNCFKTETNWILTWGPKNFGPDNLKSEGTFHDSWTTLAWYAPDIGLVRRTTSGKGYIELLAPTSVEAEDFVNSSKFQLMQNYPNPFNPITTINYHLNETLHVTLKIYNTVGELINTFIKNSQASGTHSIIWDGTDSLGRLVSSDVYLYCLETEHGKIYKKMILLR